MGYDLEHFCLDLRSILKEKGQRGLPELAERLKDLLVNPAFIDATFSADSPPGKRELYHDPVSDAYVLAHVHAPNKTGMPHSHGASWAIYGNVRGATDMTEWRRVNPASEDRAVLTIAEQYRLGPGDSRAYAAGAIHSTANAEPTWVIRVTGTDLDVIPRYRFAPKKDEIVAATA